MKIIKAAVAGTLESNDVMVTVVPNDEGEGIEFELNSVVIQQYGNHIRKVVFEILKNLEAGDIKIYVNDRGALDCTIKARVECAIFRAAGQAENLPWGGKIKA